MELCVMSVNKNISENIFKFISNYPVHHEAWI